MKLKKVLPIVLIVLAIFTTVSFATTKINTNNTIENSSNTENANSVDEFDGIPEEYLIPALEAKLQNKKNNTNTSANTSTSTNKITIDDIDPYEGEVKKKTPSTSPSKNLNTKNEILDDVYEATREVLEYKDVTIKGNIYIVSSNNILMENTEIYGNVFILTKNIELNNVVVNGSIYIAATDNMNITNSNITSAYVMAERVNIDEKTKFETDLRAAGGRVYLSSNIGRNAYITSEYVKIADEAKVVGECEISSKEYDISEKINYSKVEIKPYEYQAPTVRELVPELLTEFAIILVVSIFILGGAPKFTEINLKLSRWEFIKAFFTGIIELVVICAAAIGIMIWGFGVGYSVSLLILTFTTISLGKIIFILAYSIRMIRRARRTSRRKAFVAEFFVALAVEAIGLIAVFGDVGFAASVLIDLILGIVGFGTLVRVIITPRPKAPKKDKNEEVKEVIAAEEKTAPIASEVAAPQATSPVVAPQICTGIPNFETATIVVQAKEVRIENVGKIEILDKKEEKPVVAVEESEKAPEPQNEVKIQDDVEPKLEANVAPENENIDNNKDENDSEKE